MTRHDAWLDAAAAWLLGALPQEEAAALEAHLASCPACRAETEELRVAADALPLTVTQMLPSPELRARVLEAAQADGAVSVEVHLGRPGVLRRWLEALRRPAPMRIAVATLAVGAVLGVVASGALRGSSSPATRTVAANVAARGAVARIEVRDGTARLVAQGLPRPPAGRVYEVWIQRRGKAAPEPTDALFDVRAGGHASVDVPGDVHGVERVMVTDEPAGGSTTPTGKLLLTAALPS